MSILDAYGDFDVPEEKSVIEVVEDPVKVIISCYDLFKRTSKQFFKNDWYRSEKKDLVYNEALKVYEGKQELKVDEKQLEQIIEELRKRAKNFDGTGLFLSAMLNTTKINMLFVDEFPELDLIGYKIGKNKAVILGPKNNSFEIGGSAKEGSVTINQGTTDFQGCEAEGGSHINQGTIHYDQGLGATGGNHINQGTTQYQGWYASGGNHINQGTTHDQGWYVSGGNHINQGTTTTQGYNATGGNHINIKTVKKDKGKLVIDLSQKQHPLKSQLEQKLDELEFLKTKDADRLIQLINDYNWKKFDIQLNEICEKIKKVYGK